MLPVGVHCADVTIHRGCEQQVYSSRCSDHVALLHLVHTSEKNWYEGTSCRRFTQHHILYDFIHALQTELVR